MFRVLCLPKVPGSWSVSWENIGTITQHIAKIFLWRRQSAASSFSFSFFFTLLDCMKLCSRIRPASVRVGDDAFKVEYRLNTRTRTTCVFIFGNHLYNISYHKHPYVNFDPFPLKVSCCEIPAQTPNLSPHIKLVLMRGYHGDVM